MECPASLNNSLFELSSKIDEKIVDLQKEGKFRIVPYEKIRIAKIDYIMESFQYDWDNVEFFDSYEWDSEVFSETLQSFRVIPEFDIAAAELAKTFPLEIDIIKKFGLMNFVRILQIGLPNEWDRESFIKENIKLFINDYHALLNKLPIIWNIKVWLNSLKFEGNDIGRLSETTYLRRPKDEDFVLVRPRGPFDEFERITGKGFPLKSIISLAVEVPNNEPKTGFFPKIVEEEIENWVDIFRLYNVANITIKHISARPESIWEGWISDNPESPFDSSWKGKLDHSHTSNFSCLIKESELAQLNDFALKLKPILSTISHQAYLTGSHYDLAFHRYKDALLKSRVNVNRILSAISSLEALLSESSGDITYKISSRTSLLLSFFGFPAIDVFEKLKVAYDLRSKLVHGGNLGEVMMEFSKNHIHEILEYTRISLLISLQLKDYFADKNTFIKRIDYALVDNDARIELQETIKRNTIIPLSHFRYCIEYTQYSRGEKWITKKI